MEQLLIACRNILRQLEDVVDQIEPGDFCKPSINLNNATVGQHLRHTIEFFICLKSGFETGCVNYDNRQHNELMERDRLVAVDSLHDIQNFILSQKANKPLKLELTYERAT